jgi:hypothetical protein
MPHFTVRINHTCQVEAPSAEEAIGVAMARVAQTNPLHMCYFAHESRSLDEDMPLDREEVPGWLADLLESQLTTTELEGIFTFLDGGGIDRLLEQLGERIVRREEMIERWR